MKARLALVLVVLLTAASLFTLFAQASHQDIKDGNDVKGKLDIRAVNTFGKTHSPGWKINVSSRTGVKQLRDRGFFLVYFDTFNDSAPDYYLLVSSNGSKLLGKLWRDRTGKPDRKLGKVPVWRSNKSSATVRVPLSELYMGGKERLTYRWWVKTLFTGRKCHRVCIDRAPNKGAVTESNGKPSPSPTDTEGPGLTETPAPSTTAPSTPPPSVTPGPTESPGS
jgi:hypothetical protein